LLNLSLSNATISSTSGNATLTVTDASTGTMLGQQTFGWTVVGNSIYAQNPAAVHDWLQQFTGYSNVDVGVQVVPTLQAADVGSASATANAEYTGTTYASTTVGWDYVKPAKCIPGSPCPIQN
jgi:hypothetical protein